MQLAVKPEFLLVESDRQCDTERIAVFERDGAFNAHYIGGEADMIIIGRHYLLQLAERLHILSAKGDLGLIVRDKLIARAWTAYCVQLEPAPYGVKLFLPHLGVCQKPAVGRVHKSLGDAEHRNAIRYTRQHILAEPIDTETRNTADYHVGALDSSVHILYLIKFDTIREIPFELGMAVRALCALDYLAVKRSADDAHPVAVFSCGKSQSGTHHSRPDDSYCCHCDLLASCILP